MQTLNRRQRIIMGILSGVVVVVQLFSFVSPVNAIGGVGDQTFATIVEDIPARVESISAKAGKAIYTAGLSALVNGAALFMKKLAYDSAVAISTGGKGQSALFVRNPGKYFKDSGEAAAAEAILSLGDSFGVDLCKIPDLRVNVYLKIGFRRLYTDADGAGGPKPKCTLSQITSNFSKYKEQYTGDQLLSRFNADVKVEESDLGISLGYLAKLDRVESEKRETNIAEYLANKGFKPITDLISGNVKTPAAVIEEETTALGPANQGGRSLDQINGIYGAGAAQILPVAASVFLNTLTSQLLDKALRRGMFANGTDVIGDGGNPNNFYGGTFTDNRRAAEQAFSFLFTAIPTRQPNAYDILAEFSSCPDNPGLNNCVIDGQMQKLIDLSRTEGSVTIGEAIERGYLNPEFPLISPQREFQHTDINCYLEGYCYANIQKLRKVRILPLGFEVAALYSDPDVPWKLGEVVKNFENCARNAAGVAIADPRHPFCHLIDPNWIIKAPEARCEAKVHGSERADDLSPLRKQECVDVSTCILEGANGECLGTYGYCTKEQNVWRMGGDSCQAQFATCKTYMAQDGAVASYLARTLDYGECSSDSVGCRAYSLEQSAGAWVQSLNDQDSTAQTIQFQKAGRSQAMYLNGKVDNQSCSMNDEGCSAFTPAVKNQSGAYQKASGQPLYLKKAPTYLGCYDMNTATAAIDWPETKSELLTGLNKDAQCGKFAQACIAEEVGCDGFTPKNGGPMIPGVVGNNACSQICVGYDAYRQEASEFDTEMYPVYLIPNTTDPQVHALSCPEKFAGCDEFTNLEPSSQGGESLEYYTDLKYCEKPNGNNQKTYYSWEGDRNQGYLLRVHQLLQVNNEVNTYVTGFGFGDEFQVGSPSYQDMTPDSLTEAVASCNQNAYELLLEGPDPATGEPRDGAADAGCRALYDDEGNITYRILEDTVTVSDQCKRLRKTDTVLEPATYLNETSCRQRGGFWSGNSCQVCMNGGRYEGGACVYQTIPSQATSCRGPVGNPAQYKGCRIYTGKDGNDVKHVFKDEFEPTGESPEARTAAQGRWTGGVVSDEATQARLHSLAVDNQEIKRTIAQPTEPALKNGERYELTFWARGVPQNLRVEFQAGDVMDELTSGGALSVGNIWQRYQVSGVITNIQEPENGVQLSIRSERDAGTFFIDNIILRRVNATVALVKNSWEIPEVCDRNPADGLPGMALGCSEYKNSANDPVFTTGFEKLCRAEAIGCQPMYDTFNTTEGKYPESAHAYNVWCEAETGTSCMLTGDYVQSSGSCSVKAGEAGCYIDMVTFKPTSTVEALPTDNIRPATVIVPADTPTNDPIFLTVREEFTCQGDKKGCQKVGLEEKKLPSDAAAAYTHTATYVRNDPDAYTGANGILCRADLVGCGEFKNGSTVTYFKDPIVTGNSLCEYKDFIPTQGGYGWVLKGVGQCSNDDDKACKANSDCVTETDQTATCKNIGAISCYNDNITQGGEQGIWSNKSDRYLGFVGVCPAEANQCTELVDVQATANGTNEGSNKYYAIFDSKITSRVEECNGQVSLKEGCVLFDKTDNPNKIYNAKETYLASGRVQDGLVSPETSTGPFDSNIILKVDRDRMCSEWLACKSSIVHTDERGVKTNLCYQYKTCKGTRPGVECTDWVDDSDVSGPSDQFLSQEEYIGRSTNWSSEDYSGYSLFNKYQINNLVYLHFTSTEEQYQELLGEGYGNTTYAAYEADARFFAVPPAGSRNIPDYSGMGCAKDSRGNTKKDWDKCGFDSAGRCYTGRCVYPVDGQFSSEANATVGGIRAALDTLGGGTCKGYPEDSSPFSSADVLEKNQAPVPHVSFDPFLGTRYEYVKRARPFEGVNVCQGSDCSCEYKKITYKNGETDYITLRPLTKNGVTEPKEFPGICVGGIDDGAPCGNKADCRADGNGENGECSLQAQTQTHYGLQGYCLEKDLSRPFNTEKNDYACLTWLPIQVSASGVDLYNQNTHAGYDPNGINDQKADADINSGQAYCIAATSAGQGPFDTAMYESPLYSFDTFGKSHYLPTANAYVMNSNQSFFDTIFSYGTTNNQSGLPTQENDCVDRQGEDITNSQIAFCGGMSELPANAPQSGQQAGPIATVSSKLTAEQHLYSAMQHWLWHGPNFGGGGNAVILRLEHNGISTGYIARDYTAAVENAVNGGPGSEAPGTDTYDCENCSVAHFAPMHSDAKKPLEERSFGYGTVMHPPRMWGVASPALGSNAFLYYYKQTDGKVPRYIDPSLMSPGYEYVNSVRREYVYRSPSEGALRESDVQKVYFVPTGFPGGAEGVNPELLSSEVFIDFKQLRTSNTRSYAKDVKATVSTDNQGVFLPDYGKTKTGRMKVWSYMLEAPNLLSFTNYSQPDQTRGSLLADGISNSERNQIYHRYVVVAAGRSSDKSYPPFMPATVGEAVAPVVGTDPFLADACKSAQDDGENWVAIGMDFNNKGEFLGYISRWCGGTDSGDDADNGIQFAVIATINNQCSSFATVVGSGQDLNKAWTQRVWKYGGQKNHPDAPYAQIARDAMHHPFGSLNIQARSVVPSNKVALRSNFAFDDAVEDGIPYSCDGMKPLGATGLHYAVSAACDALQQTSYGGSIYPIVKGKTVIDATRALQRLFQKIYSIVTVSDSPSAVVISTPSSDADSSMGVDDLSGNEDELGGTLPPQIYSLNPAKCFTVAGARDTGCVPGEKNNITVNGKNGTMRNYDGDSSGRADEDIDGDGAPDPIIQIGSYVAIVKFFAFADDNRMPIRRVLVEWGDKSEPSGNTTGFYKNSKPFCEIGDEPLVKPNGQYNGPYGECVDRTGKPTGVTCKDTCPADQTCTLDRSGLPNGYEFPRFGDMARSCTNVPFEFVHTYTCGPSELDVAGKPVRSFSEKIKNRLIAQGLSEDAQVCSFTPRAQVLDNWGWCNGDIEQGYYNDGDRKFCERYKLPPYSTPYKGQIIVIPAQR